MAEEIKNENKEVEENNIINFPKQEEIKKETAEPVSKIYRLIEMSDAMIASKDNAETVLKQQLKLMAYLEKNEDKEFEELINSMKLQNKNLEVQIAKLDERSTKLKEVCEIAKSSEEIEKAINMLLECLGIFENN